MARAPWAPLKCRRSSTLLEGSTGTRSTLAKPMKYSTWNRRETPRVFRLPSWQIALLLLVALALGIAIAIVATGIFLIALPVAAVAVVAYRLFGGRRRP